MYVSDLRKRAPGWSSWARMGHSQAVGGWGVLIVRVAGEHQARFLV